MAPVLTSFHTVLRRWMVLCAVGVSFAAGAQTRPALIVHPADQARRDATRAQILQAELASETAALAKAEQRQAERSQAGDHVGAVEARQAVRRHAANVEALRREIHLVVVPPGVPQAVSARPAPLPGDGAFKRSAGAPPLAAGSAQAAAPGNADTPPTWGMYPVHRAQQLLSAPLNVAPEQSLPAWDLYAASRGTAVRKPVVRPEVVLTEVRTLAPPAVPYLVYRDPNAHREPRITGTLNAGRN